MNTDALFGALVHVVHEELQALGAEGTESAPMPDEIVVIVEDEEEHVYDEEILSEEEIVFSDTESVEEDNADDDDDKGAALYHYYAQIRGQSPRTQKKKKEAVRLAMKTTRKRGRRRGESKNWVERLARQLECTCKPSILQPAHLKRRPIPSVRGSNSQ